MIARCPVCTGPTVEDPAGNPFICEDCDIETQMDVRYGTRADLKSEEISRTPYIAVAVAAVLAYFWGLALGIFIGRMSA